MKKLVLTTIAAVALMACNSNSGTEEATSSQMPDLTAWLDSIDNLGDLTAEQMTAITGEYEAATAGIDVSTLSEEDKKALEMAQERWEAFKLNSTPMDEEIPETVSITDEHKQEIITEFLGNYKMENMDDFSFMTGENALSVYQAFSEKAKAHKDDYNSDDWNFVKAMYEKMDARKNEIEPNLKGADNMKIAKIKVLLAPMFKIEKLKSKVEEKVEQKEAEAEAAE